MHKFLILLLINYLGFVINLFGQENIVSYSTVMKNGKPDYILFDGKYITSGVFDAIRVWNVKTREFVDYPTIIEK